MRVRRSLKLLQVTGSLTASGLARNQRASHPRLLVGQLVQGVADRGGSLVTVGGDALRTERASKQWSPWTASAYGQAGANGTLRARSPRWPCQSHVIHNGPDRSRADSHGQHHSDPELRRLPPSQVTNAPDLAMGARGRGAALGPRAVGNRRSTSDTRGISIRR